MFYLHVTPSWQPTECYRMARGARGRGGHAAAAAFAYLQKPAAPTGHGQRLCVCYAAPQLRHCLLSVAESGQHGMGTVKLAIEREGGEVGVGSGGGWSGRRLECAWYAHSQIKIHIFEFGIRSSWLRSAFDERGNCIRICICICSTASASVAKSEQAFCCGG